MTALPHRICRGTFRGPPIGGTGGTIMLQIIGLLGCVYLFVKSFEFGSSRQYRLNNGHMSAGALFAMWIAVVGSLGFAFLLIVQGEAVPAPPNFPY
jgi:hypothetical protein